MITRTSPNAQRWLHRLAAILAVGTVLLIAKGGLVHSAGAGLSVPDWPTTYGENMFTYPVEKWTGGIVYEHGHRLIASGIGVLTIVVMVMIWLYDDRRWLRWLGVGALVAVIVQGVLGGLTVLMRLPTAVSVSHAMLAQSFLIATVLMAAATAREWRGPARPAQVRTSAGLRKLLLATVIFTFVQILLGAITRHTYSGMAIIDFPMNNGKVIPDFTHFGVAIQFAHRVGAVILTAMIFTQGIRILRSRELAALRGPAALAMAMVTVQFLLGATVIWTREAIVPNTAHVAGGALTFILVFLTYARSVRFYRFAEAEMDAPAVRLDGVKA
ncbi:MAG: COX15/CtaA family protein [Bacteroidota bacterium]|jgi:cytochrome c oxidase assembly protein subunit 15|nr:COX15/CtaA family protein [Bacteroidota bacterium]